MDLANEALTLDLAIGDSETWGIGPGQQKSAEEILDAIDRGNFEGGNTGSTWYAFWMIGEVNRAVFRDVDNRSH